MGECWDDWFSVLLCIESPRAQWFGKDFLRSFTRLCRAPHLHSLFGRADLSGGWRALRVALCLGRARRKDVGVRGRSSSVCSSSKVQPCTRSGAQGEQKVGCVPCSLLRSVELNVAGLLSCLSSHFTEGRNREPDREMQQVIGMGQGCMLVDVG